MPWAFVLFIPGGFLFHINWEIILSSDLGIIFIRYNYYYNVILFETQNHPQFGLFLKSSGGKVLLNATQLSTDSAVQAMQTSNKSWNEKCASTPTVLAGEPWRRQLDSQRHIFSLYMWTRVRSANAKHWRLIFFFCLDCFFEINLEVPFEVTMSQISKFGRKERKK